MLQHLAAHDPVEGRRRELISLKVRSLDVNPPGHAGPGHAVPHMLDKLR
jgi:hypothetical protein